MEGYLLRRPAGFYFRIRIPKHLRGATGKTSLVRALDTHDERHARYVAAGMSLILGRLFRTVTGDGMDIKKLLDEVSKANPRELLLRNLQIGAFKAGEIEIKDKADIELLQQMTGLSPESLAKTMQNAPAPLAAPAPSPAGGSLLSEVKEIYISRKTGEAKGTSVSEYGTSLRLLIEAVGDKPINHISNDDITAFLSLIDKLPRDTTKRAEFKGKRIRECVETNKILNSPTIGVETRKKHFRFCNQFFNWAIAERLHSGPNPFAGRKYLKNAKGPGRKPFTDTELQTIFSASNYAQLARDPADYWLPLLGLYTGCRISELTQLFVDDVKVAQDIHYLDINENHPDKNLKNEQATRIIPLHPVLIDSGFLDYVADVRKRKFQRLFPHLTRDHKNKNFSRNATAHFKNYMIDKGLRKKGEDDRYAKGYHCFRHNFCDYYKDQLSIGEDKYYEVSGHKHDSITESWYTSRQRLPTKAELIGKIAYSDIDWTVFAYEGRFAEWLDLVNDGEEANANQEQEKAQRKANRAAAVLEREKRALRSRSRVSKPEDGGKL
jgi:integrase